MVAVSKRVISATLLPRIQQGAPTTADTRVLPPSSDQHQSVPPAVEAMPSRSPGPV